MCPCVWYANFMYMCDALKAMKEMQGPGGYGVKEVCVWTGWNLCMIQPHWDLTIYWSIVTIWIWLSLCSIKGSGDVALELGHTFMWIPDPPTEAWDLVLVFLLAVGSGCSAMLLPPSLFIPARDIFLLGGLWVWGLYWAVWRVYPSHCSQGSLLAGL